MRKMIKEVHLKKHVFKHLILTAHTDVGKWETALICEDTHWDLNTTGSKIFLQARGKRILI